MNKIIAKLLVSFIGVFTAIGPYLADWNKTHIYNPYWPPHAKFHNAQTMLMGTALGFLSLWYLWRRAPDDRRRANFTFAIILSSLYWITQAGAILYPGTAFMDPLALNGANVPPVLGLPSQLFLDISVFLLLGAAIVLEVASAKTDDLTPISQNLSSTGSVLRRKGQRSRLPKNAYADTQQWR